MFREDTIMRNGMTCPKDRGGCGKPLAWDDGAFCQECMTKALYERKNEAPEKTAVSEEMYRAWIKP
jgi:hypothetical protein